MDATKDAYQDADFGFCAICPVGQLVAIVSATTQVRIFHALWGSRSFLRELPGAVRQLLFSPNGQLLGVSLDNGTIQLFDTNGLPGAISSSMPSFDRLRLPVLSSDGRWVLLILDDHSLRLLNSATGDHHVRGKEAGPPARWYHLGAAVSSNSTVVMAEPAAAACSAAVGRNTAGSSIRATSHGF